ncbi:MAG: hypothetical protein RIT45_90 [Pseudomonadota bacterium]|jgi:hypothetical protein
MHGISHSMEDEGLAAKVEWFRKLSPLQRYETAMQMLAMLQALQPELGSREQDDDRRPSATVRIVEAPRR